MKRRMRYGWLWAVLLVLAALAAGCGKKEETYRDIRIMSIEGTATVVRESVGELKAYEEMKLESGDALSVDTGSSLILSLDGDKYVLLESGTRMTLEADGTGENSRTALHLEEGAVVSHLTRKLNEESSYEVMAPNSTMAVRGTVFRVKIVYDENGDSYATVTVLDGVVASRLVFPDGTEESVEQERQIPPGMGVNVYGNTEISKYYPDDLEEVDLSQYSKEALRFLLLCMDRGAELSVSREECEALLNGEAEEEPEAAGPTPRRTAESVQKEETPARPALQPLESEEPAVQEAAAAAPPPEEKKSSSGSGSSGSSGSSAADTQKKTYTVTFTYDGKTFCTQSVQEGAKASEPVLMPTASGSWAYDFDTAVTGSTTIQWTAVP